MRRSRTEVNFQRLVGVCESLINEENVSEDWRFKAYVETLSQYIRDIKGLSTLKPSKEDLFEYQRKVTYFQSFLPDDLEILDSNLDSLHLRKNVKTNGKIDIYPENASVSSKKLYMQVSGENHNKLKTKHAKKNDIYSFGDENFDENAFLKTNRDIQDNLTEQMAALVKDLKANVSITSTIVKKDNKVLGDSMMLQSKNFTKLKEASEKLEITKSKANPCWIWILLIVVFASFFWMIFFIKLFSKKY